MYLIPYAFNGLRGDIKVYTTVFGVYHKQTFPTKDKLLKFLSKLKHIKAPT